MLKDRFIFVQLILVAFIGFFPILNIAQAEIRVTGVPAQSFYDHLKDHSEMDASGNIFGDYIHHFQIQDLNHQCHVQIVEQNSDIINIESCQWMYSFFNTNNLGFLSGEWLDDGITYKVGFQVNGFDCTKPEERKLGPDNLDILQLDPNMAVKATCRFNTTSTHVGYKPNIPHPDPVIIKAEDIADSNYHISPKVVRNVNLAEDHLHQTDTGRAMVQINHSNQAKAFYNRALNHVKTADEMLYVYESMCGNQAGSYAMPFIRAIEIININPRLYLPNYDYMEAYLESMDISHRMFGSKVRQLARDYFPDDISEQVLIKKYKREIHH